MIAYPPIDPELVRVGPLAVRWYGLMYAFGFGASYALVRFQTKRASQPLPEGFLDSLYTWLVLGVLLGGRLGYVLFYDLTTYLHDPLEIVAVWHGGMSFHGGLIGTLAGGAWCCRKYTVGFWKAADLVIVTAPVGLGLGRLGNFINGELYGRVTDVPWAMVFPNGGTLPRHPSQLYELLLEGVLLFAILWTVKGRLRFTGGVTALFLMLYGLFRFLVEFVREPDQQLGFVLGPFTMGQVLSIATAAVGVALFLYRRRHRPEH
jgi:phosphatidylglycerol:prolipoprotein diacylglycerol transferase